jgi:two-component system sensor histidine kinase KdpD
MDKRPDPDQLLNHIQRDEAQKKRGKLKIFLGYAAGVGKTYTMLEAARQRHEEGLDVVIGYIETHGRAETDALLEGLEILPRREIIYRDIHLTEMDADAILARRPQIVLVDELAHTNVPGSRHTRRYQDVLDLLYSSIDVYTTVNIQHLESLNDVVSQVTGVTVQETVPDHILDEAHEIELIDLPIDELLVRLEAGKVYVPAQAEQALRRFFRPGNLTALREMALRRAADRVDEQMRAYMQTHAIPGPWPAGERLMVCVSPSPLSERLVRTTRRLARRLDAEWIAAYVEIPARTNLSEAEEERVAQTLRLAEELGAQTVRLTGHSVAETLTNYGLSPLSTS